MGYGLHITRRAHWSDEHGPEISAEEWVAYAATDPELEITGAAEAVSPQGETIRMASPGLTRWVQGGETAGWLSFQRGSLSANNPSDDFVIKMHRISVALGAKLEGDEGELYDAAGRMIRR